MVHRSAVTTCDGDVAARWGKPVAVCAGDLGDQAVSAEQPELSSDPGGTTQSFAGVFWGRGKEEGLQVAVAEAAEGELTARDCGQQRTVITEGAKSTHTA